MGVVAPGQKKMILNNLNYLLYQLYPME